MAELDELAVKADAAKDSDNEREQRMASHRSILYGYTRILGGGSMSAAQEARVMAQLDQRRRGPNSNS